MTSLMSIFAAEAAGLVSQTPGAFLCFWAVRHGGFLAAHVAAFLTMTPPAVGYAVERGEAIARNKGYAL
jgi:hypothetical protein